MSMQTNNFVEKRQPFYELVHSVETRAPKELFTNTPIVIKYVCMTSTRKVVEIFHAEHEACQGIQHHLMILK